MGTCIVSPTSVTPSSSGVATAMVTLTTTAQTEIGPRLPEGPRGSLLDTRRLTGWPAQAGWLWLVALAFLAFAGTSDAQGFRRALRASPEFGPSRGRFGPAARITCALEVLMVLAWAACGGSGFLATHSPGTPPGTYSLVLTANSRSLSQSAIITLTVGP